MINPPSDCVDDDRVEPPLGLLYIAATALQSGFDDITLYDMSGCKSDTEISEKISQIPDGQIYGIGSFSTNYRYAKDCIKAIRANKENVYVLMGGVNATALPQFTSLDSGVDTVITGEGEDAFCYAAQNFLDGRKVTGIIQGFGRTNINTYAFPTRQLIEQSSYSRKLMGEPVISMLSSRGCVHQCLHCNSVVMGGGNNTVRYRSTANILQELELIRLKYRNFRFNDDHFTGNPNLTDLLKKMKNLDIAFRVFARIEDLDAQKSRLLQDAGCIHVSVGLESLEPKNLKVIGKASQIGKERNIRFAKENGLYVRGSFIVGLPFDSDSVIEASFNYAACLGLDEFAIYPLIPYPGTLLAKFPEKFGYTITNSNFSDYVQIGKNRKTCYALKHKHFGPDDVRRWIEVGTNILETAGVKHISKSEVAT